MATQPSNNLILSAVAKNLTVDFVGRRVLHGVHLELHPGQLTVIIGRSGSGKTTLLRTFNRLNEHYPACASSGTLKLHFQDGWQDIYQDGINLAELRQRVGMVFQNPTILPFSVEKNISLPLKLILNLPRSELEGRVESALRQVHLWSEVKNRLRTPAAVLSGGQQQRLCLARTLALEPEFLLLDEPTANLDFRIAQKIEELLLEFKTRCQIVAVSHSLNQARRLADQLLVLKNGSLMSTLSPAEFQQPERWQDLLTEMF
ncbi:phosphate ABC transporter ATP-binding protein [Desulfobacca acetoxidans]